MRPVFLVGTVVCLEGFQAMTTSGKKAAPCLDFAQGSAGPIRELALSSYRSRRCSFVQEHHCLLALVNAERSTGRFLPRSRLAEFG